jgi:CheY-like chemotaxis protein
MRSPDTYILLIEPDEKTAVFLRHMMIRAGYTVHVAPTGKQGLIAAWRDQPGAIVLEMDLPDVDGLEVVRKLRADPRTNRTIMIGMTNRSSPEDAVAGLEVGLDKYILKQSDAVEVLLRDLAERAMPGMPAGGLEEGRIISFISAKGGIGTSSLTANIACNVAQADESKRVLVVDLVLPMGNLAEITGAPRRIDLLRLTELPVSAIRHKFLEDNLPILSAWDFQLLPGCITPDQAERLQEDRLAPLMQTLRMLYDYIIFDLGRTLSRITRLALSQSEAIVLVYTLDETSLNRGKAIQGYLTNAGVPADRFVYLANRNLPAADSHGHPAGIEPGTEADVSLPYLGTDLHLANSLHAPFNLRFPEHTAAVTFQRAAELIIDRTHPK